MKITMLIITGVYVVALLSCIFAPAKWFNDVSHMSRMQIIFGKRYLGILFPMALIIYWLNHFLKT